MLRLRLLPILPAVLMVALMSAPASRLAAQTITGDWYFTGLTVSADTGPISLDEDSGIATGTLTITGDTGSGFTLTPGGGGWLNLDAEAGPIPLAQDGNRYVFSQHEDGTGTETDTHAVVQWVDASTALIFYASAETVTAGEHTGGLWWLEAFGGVLTRDVLPAANASAWVGNYTSFEIAVSTDTEDGLEFLTEPTSIVAGGVEGDFVINSEDTFSLINGGQALRFLESAGTWHDEALAVQLADGRLAYAYFGVGNDGTAITFADFGVGTLTAVPEPSAYAAIFGALALGAACFRRCRFTNAKSAMPKAQENIIL